LSADIIINKSLAFCKAFCQLLIYYFRFIYIERNPGNPVTISSLLKLDFTGKIGYSLLARPDRDSSNRIMLFTPPVMFRKKLPLFSRRDERTAL
jgi:hypothetical protein